MFESGVTDQKHQIMVAGDYFYWTLDDENYQADSAYFSAQLGAIKTWDIGGSTGRILDGDYLQFFMSIPYEEVLIEKTYKLGDRGFRMFHAQSLPPELNPVATSADDAELSIRLDPAKGTAVGDFKAKFILREQHLLETQGAFKLSRLNVDK